MAEQAVARPFDEGDFDNGGRLDPPERRHVLGADALAPVTSARAVRQIDERTGLRRLLRDRREQLPLHPRREPGTTLRGVPQILALVVADQEEIERRAVGFLAADDELLVLVELHLHPGVGPLAG